MNCDTHTQPAGGARPSNPLGEDQCGVVGVRDPESTGFSAREAEALGLVTDCLEHGARVYVAGPMTGHDDFNYPAFNRAAEMLRTQGFQVENPAANPEPPCGSWAGYMRMAIRQVTHCDAVLLLKGWETSRGACIERRLAIDLGLKVYAE